MRRARFDFLLTGVGDSLSVLDSAIGFDNYLPYAVPTSSEERVIMKDLLYYT